MLMQYSAVKFYCPCGETDLAVINTQQNVKHPMYKRLFKASQLRLPVFAKFNLGEHIYQKSPKN